MRYHPTALITALSSIALAAVAQPASAKALHAKPGKPRLVRDYLAVRVKIERGRGRVLSSKRGRHARPTPIRSFWGPFELQLYAGRRRLDSIRFNFPLSLPVGERNPRNVALDRDILRGLVAETVVKVPFHETLTHLVFAGTNLDGPVRYALEPTKASRQQPFRAPRPTQRKAGSAPAPRRAP